MQGYNMTVLARDNVLAKIKARLSHILMGRLCIKDFCVDKSKVGSPTKQAATVWREKTTSKLNEAESLVCSPAKATKVTPLSIGKERVD